MVDFAYMMQEVIKAEEDSWKLPPIEDVESYKQLPMATIHIGKFNIGRGTTNEASMEEKTKYYTRIHARKQKSMR